MILIHGWDICLNRSLKVKIKIMISLVDTAATKLNNLNDKAKLEIKDVLKLNKVTTQRKGGQKYSKLKINQR